eukprot:snap_masked-scaffold_8-processed-gene-9.75-mRNA-1 protein AED:1.00 eAED:1.00 QI:0/0/0/0/1/1/2/0/98
MGKYFLHYLVEIKQFLEGFWARNTSSSVDLVERINTEDLSSIDFREIIKLKRPVKYIADDYLDEILFADVDEEVDPVFEEMEIRAVISAMVSIAGNSS